MDTSRNDLLGEIAADAALERTDFLAFSFGPAEPLPRRQREPHPRTRRPGPDRRRGRLPGHRRGHELPQPDAATWTRRPASGRARWRSSSPSRSSSSCTTRPTSSLRSRRGRSQARGGRRTVGTMTRPADDAPEETVAAAHRLALCRGRRRLGRRARDEEAPETRGRGRRAAVRPGAGLPGEEPADRGAPARAVRVGRRGAGRRAGRVRRHRRRRRAADAAGHRLVSRPRSCPRRATPIGRVAQARQPGRHRRVLRPDGHLRRPGRRPGRGLPRSWRARSPRTRKAQAGEAVGARSAEAAADAPTDGEGDVDGR